MLFKMPDASEFEIPEEWWTFAEMDKFSPMEAVDIIHTLPL
jgi:hypothetical protein